MLETWISTVCLTSGETRWTLSHSLFLFMCQLSLPLPPCACCLLLCQICTDQPQGMSNLSFTPIPPHTHPPPTTQRCYNPTISNLSVSRTTLTRHSAASPPSSTKPPLISFHRPLYFTPSRVVWVSGFHPQCRIPHLISRYAGMIGRGQQAVAMIPQSPRDYRVQLSKPLLLSNITVLSFCPFLPPTLWQT